MPNVDFTGVQESKPSSGSFNLEPGGYVMAVTDFSAPMGKTYVQLMLDVAEGPQAGFYKGAQRPLSLFLNWGSDRQKSFLLHHLHAFADSNSGFDPVAAFKSDQWQQFVGRSIGCVVRMEMHTYEGKDYENSEVYDTITPEQVRSGDFVVPGPRDRREKAPATAAPNPPSAPVAATGEKMPWE